MKKNGEKDTIPAPPPFGESWSAFLAQNGLCRATFERFRTIILHHYLSHQREFEWRSNITAYRVLVSELMLQQTQTSRVVYKYPEFIKKFSDVGTLASAPFAEVLKIWKGLGYNRRAKYLHEIAGLVVDHHQGNVPTDPQVLETFPGIGPATAAAISVFSCNRPLAFIETNIRTVFIYFFFRDKSGVDDREIFPLVEKTIDRRQPRQWYYALMDYGVMLKKVVGNLSRQSRHYSLQSRFEGSDRQLRGKILQLLLDQTFVTEQELAAMLGEDKQRIARLVSALCNEGIIVKRKKLLLLD